MKAVILAAGKGTRMMPLTRDTPKPLLLIHGKPWICYLMDHLSEVGVTEFGIVAGYKIEKMRAFAQESDEQITIIEQENPQGTGDAVRMAQSFTGDDDFLLVAGDHLWSVNDINRVWNCEQTAIGALQVEDWHKYGVLMVKDGLLQGIKEKPKEFVGDLINTSLYRFTPDIYRYIEQLEPSERGEYEITDALTAIAKNQKVRVVSLEDYWLDLGTLEDIPKVSQHIAKLN